MSSMTWIKLSTDFFEDPKINRLLSYPESRFLPVFWIRLMLIARENGMVTMDDGTPYNIDDFSLFAIRFYQNYGLAKNVVTLALSVFKELGMLKVIDTESGPVYTLNDLEAWRRSHEP